MYLNTNDRKECCGCKVCADICPTECIDFKEDSEHFLYPEIDKEKCIECKLCEKVCPIQNKHFCEKEDIDVYAAKYLSDEVIFNSSSGGAFTAIYKVLLKKEYSVFGVRWTENLKVVHDIAINEKECEKFRKSKYIMSDVNHSYSKIKDILLKGGKVLFTGTPCQCAALGAFLETQKIERENLIVVDLICHGAPNQYLFDKYISEKIGDALGRCKFNFRNKIPYQDKINSRTVSVEDFEGKTSIFTVENDPFLQGYYGRLFYRPYCAECSFAVPQRVSDVTIGDAWHIEDVYGDWNSLEGISLLLINTEKGKKLFKDVEDEGTMELRKMDIDWAIKNNAQLREPTKAHPERKLFFELLKKNSFEYAVRKSMKEFICKKILRKIKGMFFKISHRSET